MKRIRFPNARDPLAPADLDNPVEDNASDQLTMLIHQESKLGIGLLMELRKFRINLPKLLFVHDQAGIWHGKPCEL